MKEREFQLKRGLAFLYINFFLIFLSGSLKANIENYQLQFEEVALKIWEYAEIGYKEHESSNLLQNHLAKEGFKITKEVAGIPTAT